MAACLLALPGAGGALAAEPQQAGKPQSVAGQQQTEERQQATEPQQVAGDKGGGRAKAEQLGVGAAVVRWRQGVRFYVDGLAFDEVSAWLWSGRDITEPLQAAFADGSAAVSPTLTGFKLEWRYPPQALNMGGDGRLGLQAKSLDGGVLQSSAAKACPGSIVFGEPTSPTLKADTSCLFEGGNCAQPGVAPVAIDYAGAGSVLAVAAGTVVRVELSNIGDHGRGTHILVRHWLPEEDCVAVYSSYSHLDSIALGIAMNTPVAKGQVLGKIGGSGYGKPDYYSNHLHLEIKLDPGDYSAPGLGKPDEQGRLDPVRFLSGNFTVQGYRQVSKGVSHACGIREDGSLHCWGQSNHGQTTPPAGIFKQVSVGGEHSCALREDFSAVCWGWNGYGQATVLPGRYAQVSAGGRHSCAVKTDGGISCWGNDWWGQGKVPEGKFTQVSAGGFHTCALKLGGALACWGNDASKQASPPDGSFKQIGAGESHTCAIKADDKLDCWGDGSAGQADPPEGNFKQLDTVGDYNCAVRIDGFTLCWGQEPKPKD